VLPGQAPVPPAPVPGEPLPAEPPPAEPLPAQPPPAEPLPPGPAPAQPLPVPSNPEGFEFTPPDAKRAQAHADRLRASPTDATLKGYPTDLVPRARAEVALEPGTKPVLILFYDDSARASNLQAAELLPLLVSQRDRVDIVPIDVAAASTLTPAEKKLVRKFYMAYVPTTVLLAGDAGRKPILLHYQRVSAAVVGAALATR
jgi:hypothetical protein